MTHPCFHITGMKGYKALLGNPNIDKKAFGGWQKLSHFRHVCLKLKAEMYSLTIYYRNAVTADGEQNKRPSMLFVVGRIVDDSLKKGHNWSQFFHVRLHL